MSMYKIRGSAHNVIYYYRDPNGISHQHWESYATGLEAIQRKAYIDYLQKSKKKDEIYVAAMDYKRNSCLRHIGMETIDLPSINSTNDNSHINEKNINKTYYSFQEKWCNKTGNM